MGRNPPTSFHAGASSTAPARAAPIQLAEGLGDSGSQANPVEAPFKQHGAHVGSVDVCKVHVSASRGAGAGRKVLRRAIDAGGEVSALRPVLAFSRWPGRFSV
jgi:hypothetical protein